MENVRKISKKYYLREIVACFLVSCLFFNAPVALAEVVLSSNPVGTITVDPVGGPGGGYATTQSMSASDGSIGNFSNFDIASDLFVTCTQPSASANALFKVFSGDGTQILGRFDATGNIYLYDGAGIFVGASGIVNTNSFIASTLGIDNGDWQDFVGGITDKLKFGPLGVEDLRSAVENQGTITAPDGVYLVGAQVLNSGTINSDLVVMAAGEKVYLKHADSKVYVETPADLETPDLTFNKVDNSGTIAAGAQVLLAAGDIFSTALNVASLAATANRDITLTGAVQTEGDMELVADFDGSGGASGGTMWAQSTLTSTSGSIDISASDDTIDLDDDVTADVDLTLNNDTVAADGISLTAGQNVDIATGKILTAEGSLSIEATAGEIIADTSIIDMDADGETLSLTQNESLHLTANFNIGNRDDTDLVANSAGGSVTSTQADIWNTIEATADTFIDLDDSGSGGSITTNSLTAGGDIDVTSNHGDVVAQGTVGAGGNIAITADDNIDLQAAATAGGDITLVADAGGSGVGDVDAEALTAGGTVDISASDTTINLHDDVTADVDILLNNNTVADAGITLDAGQDVILADSKTMTGNGILRVEADRDITLGGAVYAAGNLNLSADDDMSSGGDVWAKSSLATSANMFVRGDNIQVDGTAASKAGGMLMVATGNITLGDAAIAGGGMGLHADDDGVGGGNMWAKSSLASLGDMVVRGENIQVDGFAATASGMLMVADDDITLGSATSAGDGMGLYADDDGVDGGNMWAKSSLTTSSGNMVVRGKNIQVDGIADSGAGMLMVAADNITLGDAATASGGMGLHADDDGLSGGNMWAKSSLTSGGNMVVRGENIQVDGTADSGADMLMVADDDVMLNDAATAAGDMTLIGDDDDGGDGDVVAKGNLTAGGNIDIYSSDSTTYLGGDLVQATGNITLHNNTELDGSGNQRVDAVTGTLDIEKNIDKTTPGDMTLAGGTGIEAGGNVETYDGHLIFEDDVTANGTGAQVLDADGVGADLIADDDIIKTTDGDLTLGAGTQPDAQIELAGDVKTTDGDLTFWDKVIANGSGAQTFDADGSGKKLHATSTITKTSEGNLTLRGGYGLEYEIDLDGDVTVEDGDLILGFPFSDDDTTVAAGKTLSASDDIRVYDNLYGEGDLTVSACDDVMLFDDVEAAGDLDIYASDDTIYLWGDAYAAGDLSLHANTEFEGWFDQYVDAGGMLTADGYLRKLNNLCCLKSDGSLYLHAVGDISLADYVTAATDCEDCPGHSYGGGVSIISDTGKIFTPDDGDNDTLNVAITGRSVDATLLDGCGEGIGVDLPHGPGKAAIVIQSAADLKLGSEAELKASGMYDNTGIVDDRSGVNFLDEPATIGGMDRDEGDPIDVAIYVASTEGDVDVSSPVSIKSAEWIEYMTELTITQLNGNHRGEWVCEPKGTMVIDAFDTVTFDAGVVEGTPFQDSLEAGLVGDRLEVCSRITEWLFQATGRLPFAGSAASMSNLWYGNPDSYVLRGAGLGNLAITDGRAWVLENPLLPPPLYEEAGQPAEEQEFGEGGCPALMNWLAGELGIEEDEIEVAVGNAFAYSTDIQPCEACARLKDAATILADEEGTGVAGLVQVVNEFVATPAPPSEEQMASIATAFADHTDDGTYYAAAGAWIDALVEYVGILTFEMGYSAEESTGYANKYIGPVTDTGNASLVAYVQARLAALGG